MALNFSELRELLLALNQTDISELTLKSDEFELKVRRGTAIESVAAPPSETPSRAAIAPIAEVSAPPSPAVSSPPPPVSENRFLEIKSPMVGTFYRAPAPDEAPFVEVGDRIKSGQTVCIIEAMKLMNEIESELTGEIVEILVQNAQPVEFGQVLMRINPG